MERRIPEDYDQVQAYLESNYEEVLGDEFYSDIFPDNEVSGEMHTDYSYPNAIFLYKDENERMRRRIMLKDTWSDDFINYIERNTMTLCSGLTYRGRANRLPNAQRMNAMIFDVDQVGLHELREILYRTGKPGDVVGRAMPMPTYIVTSGSGLHLYYVFNQPVDLYPNIKLQLKAMKYGFTNRLWDPGVTTQNKDIQYQGIAQGFRMVGSINNKYGTVIRSYKTGEKISFEYFNQFARDDYKVDIRKPYRPTQISLKEAQHKYPEWYQKRIVEGDQSRGHWHIKKDLYNWWKRQVNTQDFVKGGHRYFYLMCLAIYASKCDVSLNELKKDMYELFPQLQSIKHEGDPFTKRDLLSALETYDKAYYCFTISDIEHLMAISIPRNRRNYRTQEKHLIMARFVRDIVNDHADTWREGNGRPKGSGIAQEKINVWREAHPNGKKVDCIRDTGFSKPTVYKWWDYKPEEDAESK